MMRAAVFLDQPHPDARIMLKLSPLSRIYCVTYEASNQDYSPFSTQENTYIGDPLGSVLIFKILCGLLRVLGVSAVSFFQDYSPQSRRDRRACAERTVFLGLYRRCAIRRVFPVSFCIRKETLIEPPAVTLTKKASGRTK